MSDADSLEDSLGNLQEILRKRVANLEEREREFQRMKKAFEEANPNLGNASDVLRLNVGGTRVDVLRSTLTSVEDSMLAARFSGRWDDSLEKDSDGYFFIDQPIDLFLPMIDYLRAQACMTPKACPVTSPHLGHKMDNFFRMLEYYGMTLGIYPCSVYIVEKGSKLVSGAPDYHVEADQWTTFRVSTMPGNSCTFVRSYEVTIGPSTTAQIGWLCTDCEESIEKGVGYEENSVALDCRRSGVAVGPSISTSRRAELFCSFEEARMIREGTVVRCENRGRKWYVDGTLVASTEEGDGVTVVPGGHVESMGVLIPAFSVKGSVRVSNIELSY